MIDFQPSDFPKNKLNGLRSWKSQMDLTAGWLFLCKQLLKYEK